MLGVAVCKCLRGVCQDAIGLGGVAGLDRRLRHSSHMPNAAVIRAACHRISWAKST